MNYLQKFEWRYATKRMNGQAIPAEALNNIINAISLAPTSLGLQPFTTIVVQDADIRAKMQPAAYNQPQIAEGSAVIVFAVWDDISTAQIDQYIQNIANTRGQKVEELAPFKAMIEGSIANKTKEEKQDWAARQAYIALGFGLAAAALEGVDSTPMEGFAPAQMDEVLGLNEKGLKSVVMLALGLRDAQTDYLVNAKKVRRPLSEFVIQL